MAVIQKTLFAKNLDKYAVLVNDNIIKVLKSHNVKCGVSIDGTFSHNRHRVFHNGKSTYVEPLYYLC